MYRRAYASLVGIAAVMGILAVTVSVVYDRPLIDPEGSFLGPSWLRLPLLLTGAVLLDLLPGTLWGARLRPRAILPVARERLRTHWTKDRLTLVALGIVCFYVTYVSYRNLKSALPFVRDFQDDDQMFDRELNAVDEVLFFGNQPGPVLHDWLGTELAAHALSTIYLWFIPMVPLVLTAWVVWSRNLSFGYWFATSQCIAWSLGTFSYYCLPTLGPAFYYSPGYEDLAPTPTTDLVNGLKRAREAVLYGDYSGEPLQGVVNSVAGFASLHVAITLLVALMVQFTFSMRYRVLKWVLWVNFALTVVATIYFGWHYIADDVAGIMIAFVAFYLGGLATGQKFDRHSLHSHPTTTTSAVPVGSD